jgi:hypothetical protein
VKKASSSVSRLTGGSVSQGIGVREGRLARGAGSSYSIT